MRVQFLINRPAQVDRSIHAINALVSAGHRVGVCVRNNRVASARLEAARIEHTVLTTAPSVPLGSAAEAALGAVRLGRYTRAFDPDVIVGESTSAVRAVSRLSGVRLISWTELTTVDSDRPDSPALYGAAARYHPEWFLPDATIREHHGVDEPDSYAIAQFTAKASPYNAPQAGLSRRTKRQLVETLSAAGQVYVGNTDDPHPALDASRIAVPPHETPHIADGASLLVTDSPRVAVASALCGTPTVYAHLTTTAEAIPPSIAELASQKLLRVAVGDHETVSAVGELVAITDREGIWDRRAARFFTAVGDPTVELCSAILGPIDRFQSVDESTSVVDCLSTETTERLL